MMKLQLLLLSSITLLFCVAVTPLSGQDQQNQLKGSAPDLILRMASSIEATESKDLDEFKDQLFQTLIFEFVRYDRVQAIESILDKKISLEFRDPDGNSLLHIAAENGSKKMIQLLLKEGIDPNILNNSNRTALHSAVVANDLAVVQLLLDANVDINRSENQSSLLASAWYGHAEILDLLLQKGAKVDATDSDGNTALHKAVWRGHVEIVSQLLNAGASIDCTNAAGQTPKSMANERWMEKKGGAKRSWGPEQATGAPDSPVGDNANAWASKTADGQKEWLLLSFEKPVVAKRIEIYENLAPGAVNRVTLFDNQGGQSIAWEGKDPAKPTDNTGLHVAKIQLNNNRKTRKIRIDIDSVSVNGWNEIDAVALVDQQGNSQWATWVEASSTYASGPISGLRYKRIKGLLENKSSQ